MTEACGAGPEVVAAAESSGDERSSGGRAARTTGSEGHSRPGAEARMPRTHPAVGNGCCKHPHKVGMVSDAHYLQQQIKYDDNDSGFFPAQISRNSTYLYN